MPTTVTPDAAGSPARDLRRARETKPPTGGTGAASEPAGSSLAPAMARGPAGGPTWALPWIIGAAMLLQTMSATLLSNALPTMAVALKVEPVRLNLAITLFLLCSAVFLPLSGWVADRFGAKRVFLSSMILFAASSVACGLSRTLFELLAARMFQGSAAAMMMPVGRLLLLRAVPRAQIVTALSALFVPALLGPMLGPLIGGMMVTYCPWGWLFFVNVPFALASVLLAWRFVPDATARTFERLDWRGFILMALGLGGLVVGFDMLGRGGVNPVLILATGATTVLALVLYVRHAHGVSGAILDLSLLQIPTFRISIVGSAWMRLSLAATPFLLTLLLQVAFRMSPLKAGVLTAASSLGALAIRPLAAPLLRRFGFRTLLAILSVAGALFMASYGFFRADTPYLLMMAALTAGGFFRALQFTAFGGLAFADVEEARLGAASTLSSVAQQLTQSLGVGLSAMLVHLALVCRHETRVSAGALATAFWTFGAIGSFALVSVAKLSRGAGAQLHAP